MQYIIDAGVENIHIAVFAGKSGDDVPASEVVLTADDRIQEVLKRSGLFKEGGQDLLLCDCDLYITGKLAEIVKGAFGSGTVIMPAAALWSGAGRLIKNSVKHVPL